jgi:hypothetical protein
VNDSCADGVRPSPTLLLYAFASRSSLACSCTPPCVVMSSEARGALAPAEALPPVPREGLSLAALRAFADAHAGTAHRPHPDAPKAPFEQLTTAAVCAVVIKPATLGAGAGGANCTYAELLLAQVRWGGRVLGQPSAACEWRRAACGRAPLTRSAPFCVVRARATRGARRTWRAPRTSSATRGRTRSATCCRRWRRTLSAKRQPTARPRISG